MNCPECNAVVAENRKHCGECGAPLTNDPATTGTGPPDDLLIDEPGDLPDPPLPPRDRMTVATGCDHVIGKVKENNQDRCAIVQVDYPLHGYTVIVQTGADGIGGGTGGERWADTTVHLFLAAMGVRLPAFDQEQKFVDREQFWQLLTEKVKTYFFPTINWVTGCVHSFGTQEIGLKDQRPTKVFGATWTASVMICDLKQGRSLMHAYCVGDPSLFLITGNQAQKVNTDDSHDGKLTRWVGQTPQANGQVFQREFQLDPAKLPYVHVLHCSDGLTNMLSPDVIAGVVREEIETGRAINRLIVEALNVEVPYGQILDPTQDPAITPGDDNVFAGITSIRFVSEGVSDESTDTRAQLPDLLGADEDGPRAPADGEDLRQHPDAGEERR